VKFCSVYWKFAIRGKEVGHALIGRSEPTGKEQSLESSMGRIFL
jgi:hypothetical protein